MLSQLLHFIFIKPKKLHQYQNEKVSGIVYHFLKKDFKSDIQKILLNSKIKIVIIYLPTGQVGLFTANP